MKPGVISVYHPTVEFCGLGSDECLIVVGYYDQVVQVLCLDQGRVWRIVTAACNHAGDC